MKTAKDKISVRQLFFVFTIILSSPSTRFLPKFAAAKANQAGWVSPIVSIIPFVALILIVEGLLKKYKGQSMSEIITDVFGKYLGTLILVLYLLWAFYVTAMFTRQYAERLTSSIYPNISNNIIIILSLIPIAYILRSGFTAIARMSEIILPFIGIALFLLALFLLPIVRTDNILPVYFNDIIPIFKGGFSSTAVIAYLFLMFFLSDNLVNLKSLRKFGYISVAVSISSIVLVNFVTIGVLGASTVRRSPTPVLSAVKQVSILDTIENIEAIVIAVWILTDFTLIVSMITILMKLIKSIFKISDTRPLINTLTILVYYLSLGVSVHKFELDEFSDKLIIPINLVMGFGIPIILLILSKFKKRKNCTNKN